jgi:hypothetical protein
MRGLLIAFALRPQSAGRVIMRGLLIAFGLRPQSAGRV